MRKFIKKVFGEFGTDSFEWLVTGYWFNDKPMIGIFFYATFKQVKRWFMKPTVKAAMLFILAVSLVSIFWSRYSEKQRVAIGLVLILAYMFAIKKYKLPTAEFEVYKA